MRQWAAERPGQDVTTGGSTDPPFCRPTADALNNARNNLHQPPTGASPIPAVRTVAITLQATPE